MSSAGAMEWVWIASGWVLGVVGVGLVVWALFWDRARGRERCPKCWYDMRGTEATVGAAGAEVAERVCPECGRRARGDRELRRTRRRWRVVWLCAVAALVAWWAPGAARRASARGVIGLLPTTGLVAVVPVIEARAAGAAWARDLTEEVRVRCEKGEMRGWQLRVLCAGVLRLSCRERVMVGGGVMMSAQMAPWLLSSVSCTYRSALMAGEERSNRDWDLIDLGLMEEGTREVTVDVVAETVGGECACRFSETFAVRGVHDISELFEPVSGGEIDERVRKAIECSVSRAPARLGAEAGVSVTLFTENGADPIVAELAIAAELELVENGRVVASRPAAELINWNPAGERGTSWWVELGDERASDATDPASAARWTLRVRGVLDERLARDLLRSKCWVGEFEVGLAGVLERR